MIKTKRKTNSMRSAAQAGKRPTAAEKTIQSQRNKVYGPSESAALVAHATGSCWRGLLEAAWQVSLPDIPPHVVHQMFVALKGVRASLPFKFSGDNYRDAHNYLRMAEAEDQRRKHEADSNDRVLKRIRKIRTRKIHD